MEKQKSFMEKQCEDTDGKVVTKKLNGKVEKPKRLLEKLNEKVEMENWLMINVNNVNIFYK